RMRGSGESLGRIIRADKVIDRCGHHGRECVAHQNYAKTIGERRAQHVALALRSGRNRRREKPEIGSAKASANETGKNGTGKRKPAHLAPAELRHESSRLLEITWP